MSEDIVLPENREDLQELVIKQFYEEEKVLLAVSAIWIVALKDDPTKPWKGRIDELALNTVKIQNLQSVESAKIYRIIDLEFIEPYVPSGHFHEVQWVVRHTH